MNKFVNFSMLTLSLVLTSGYAFADPLPLTKDSNNVLKCVRKIMNKEGKFDLNSSKTIEAGSILDQMITNLKSGSQGDMANLAKECKKQSLPPNSSISDKSQAILQAFVKPAFRGCEGLTGKVIASAALGAEVGFVKLVCDFNDGTRELYFGPKVGIAGGIGLAAYTGKFWVGENGLEGSGLMGPGGGILVHAGGDMNAFVGHPDDDGEQCQDCDDDMALDQSTVTGFMLMAGGDAALMPMVRLWNLKPNFTAIYNFMIQ